MCALAAPEIFDQDLDEGRVVLVTPDPTQPHRAAATPAVHVRPSGAITDGAGPD